MGQRVTLGGKVKPIRCSRSESESEQGVQSPGVHPKPERSIHGQGEAGITACGGPNPLGLKTKGMNCGWG